MSAPIDDGGPLHPVITTPGVTSLEHIGISLRDWFAGHALAGWIASRPLADGESLANNSVHAEAVAKASYDFADAMLAARKEKP